MTVVPLDRWCDALEDALDRDSDESWRSLLELSSDEVEIVFDELTAPIQLERVRALGARLVAQQTLVSDELDSVIDERRHLVTHRRAVSSYRMAEALAPIDRLVRWMWLG